MVLRKKELIPLEPVIDFGTSIFNILGRTNITEPLHIHHFQKRTNFWKNYLISIFFFSKKKTRNTDTLIHLLKGSLGTGILAMANAFHNSGYVVGFIGTIIIGFICSTCIHMLLRAHYELCRRKKVSVTTCIQINMPNHGNCVSIVVIRSGSIIDLSRNCSISPIGRSKLG